MAAQVTSLGEVVVTSLRHRDLSAVIMGVGDNSDVMEEGMVVTLQDVGDVTGTSDTWDTGQCDVMGAVVMA